MILTGVIDTVLPNPDTDSSQPEHPVDHLYSEFTRSLKPSAIRELRSLIDKPEIISFAGGEPSPEAMPSNEMRAIIRRIAEEIPEEQLHYGATAGLAELRTAALELLAGRGIAADLRDVILLNGAQRGLDLVGRLLIDPGDVVLVEAPTYSGALACFHNLRAEVIPVEMDDQGLLPDRLEEAITGARASGKKVKLLYTIPTFQNPSGISMSAERRAVIARILLDADILALEDDPYGDIWFAPSETSPIRPLCTWLGERGLYLASFSKTIAPALRTAYLKGPAEFIARVEMAAQSADLATGTLNQLVILELIRSGVLAKSLAAARILYRSQCSAMLKALDEFMPEGVAWNKPQGGFFLWLTVPDNINSVILLNSAVQRGVSFIPGKLFYPQEAGINAVRLCYSGEPAGRIRLGIASLATAIRFWDMKKKIPWALGDCC